LFPIYGNDDNWCDRARYHGYKIGIVPDARAVHDRAYREEPKEKIIFRNYYMGSLVRLCDINRPLWERFLFVCLFTLVKAVKYGSILPFKHFRSLVRMLPDIRKARRRMKE
jgi:GT2 family glycosyltransferase